MDKKSNRRLSGLVAGLLAIFVTAGPGIKPALAQTWNGSVSNQWNNASNWTPNTVPNSSSTTAIINSTTNNPVLISGINPTVGNLTLGSSSTGVSIQNGQELFINAGGTISNAGTLTINSSGSGTFLYVGNGGGTTTLNGGGTVDMTSGGNNVIYGDGNVTLDNVNNTIQGQGLIGDGHGMALQNQSIVNASVNGGTLELDGNTTINTGTLEATNGGELLVVNNVTNVGGIISTDTGKGSSVVINNQTVSGGTLNGNIHLVGNGTLDGTTNTVINQQTVTIDNGNQGTILGNIQNNGSIIVNSTGSGTFLYAGNGGTTTLTGGGTVDMTSGGNNVLYGDGNVTLVNTDNTIKGQGFIGDGHGFALQNASLVNANGGTLELDGNTTINTGTLEATKGGELLIVNSVTNTGGLISTDTGNGSSVMITNGVTVSGGTLNGNIHLDGNATLNGVTNSSTVTIDNGNQGTILGTITNNGSIIVNSTGSGTNLYVGNGSFTTTLTGGGTVDMTSGANNILYGDGNVTLDNVNNTIKGQGFIGDGHGFALQNASLVNANGGTLELDGNTTINTGTLEATKGGELLIANSVTNTGGLISTDTGNGSSVVITSGVTVSGGTLNGNIHLDGNATLNGLTNASTGTVTIDNGNQGIISGTITNNGSIIVNSTGSGTNLYVGNGGFTTTLTGGGTVDMTSSGTNVLYGDGGVTLENVNNTIKGQGIIGDGHGMILQNDLNGVVNANVTNGTLTLDGSPFASNAGTLEATNGGTLEIATTVQNNPNSTATGGLIKTDGNPNSVVLVNGGTIQGGTLNGNVQLTAGALLDGSTSQGTLHNQGTVTLLNGSQDYIAGTINNTGSIVINSSGSGTNLYVGNGGTTTLTGNGIVNMTSNGANVIYGDGSVTLDNQGNTIEGQGCIGCGHGFNLTNESAGTVLANVNGGTLNLNGGGTVTNSGTFKATNGGTLLVSETFSSADYSAGTLQGGGTYVINGTAHPSTLQINSLGTGGGEITTIGTGTTLTLNGANANVSFLDASGDNAISNLNTNKGTLNLEGGYNLSATTTFTNSGDVLIDSASSLSAPGNDYLQTAGITQADGTLSVLAVNIGGGVLEGDGTVGVSGLVQIQSGAAIQAGDTLTAPVDPPGTLDILGQLDLHTGSTVNETISGSALADISLLDVTGNVDLGSSVGVDAMLLNGFKPTTSTDFIFLTYTGTLNQQTFFVTDPTIAGVNGTWGIGYGANDAYLTFTPNGTSPVPEPATFLPLAGLLASLAYGIRRKKQSKQAA